LIAYVGLPKANADDAVVEEATDEGVVRDSVGGSIYSLREMKFAMTGSVVNSYCTVATNLMTSET
jgi:hypothetical protein